MARIITTVGSGGGTSSGGVTTAQATAIATTVARATTGYEYISAVQLTTSEVGYIEFSSLDTSTYSSFRIATGNVGLGTSSGTTNPNYITIYFMYGGTLDFGTYATEYTRLYGGSSGQFTGYNFGYFPANNSNGSYPTDSDFTMDIRFNPGANLDAQCTWWSGLSQTGGYVASGTIASVVHANNSTTINGLRIYSAVNFRSLSGTGYAALFGVRKR